MLDKETLKILEGNRPYKRMLAEYDERREFALDKTRRSFTLTKQTYWKLKQLAEKQETSMSAVIEQLVGTAT